MSSDKIVIKGARQHNLKNIDVEIPKNKLVIITGLSGSGKSSLAFDTLYAEGQRRYVESLSTYARQFLGQMEKPDVDLIDGLSPAIAIEQRSASHNPRSTVGTVTEIYDYLRLLYARVGTPFCYKCNSPINFQSLDQIIDNILELPLKSKIIVLAPLVSEQKGSHEKLLTKLKRDGFSRVLVDGSIIEIEDLKPLAKTKKHSIGVVVDRLVLNESIRNRLADSLEIALSESEGLVNIQVLEENGSKTLTFNEKAACIKCGISYPEFKPASFSFNSPQGACEKCDGLGSKTIYDPDLIVPDKDLTIREEALLPWVNRSSVQFSEFLDALTSHYKTDIYTPYKDLSEVFKNVLLYGSGNEEIEFYFEKDNRRVPFKKNFEGIIPNLERRYLETDSQSAREEIKQYMSFKPCSECSGSRLNKASRSVKINKISISDFTVFSIKEAITWISDLKLDEKNQAIADRILKEISERLVFLQNVGLGYLNLNRAASTLSGGESQRIRLATQIGSKLTGVLYVLDEPSIGLHQRDNERLLETLKKMRDLGNTVLVVEHDEDTIMDSDYVIDMGPLAGIRGGEVIFAGTPNELLKSEKSLTGQYFSGKRGIPTPSKRRISKNHLIIKGASSNNLKNVTASFPTGCFTCVTGVSGSGKSTLVLNTLFKILYKKYYTLRTPPGDYESFEGFQHIDKVVNIDQSPIGKTPRSNPGTYTGIFTFIREIFAKTPEARMRGYKAGRFSFNVKGGRCESCQGDGIVKIEMHFLPDVYVSCDVCNGKRYNRETLEITYKGKNIAEVLDMTVNQSLKFFANITNIKNKLQTLVDVGIGYIKIGQAATTLSGGEAQRIKLARELSKKGTGKTVYILDEPTTGLHIDDIEKLLCVLEKLVDSGNTVIVIEHNLDVIKYADYIIDIGPEGGDGGGTIVGSGTPEEVAEINESHTGTYLKRVL
ncbi:MAG: excinuclease ABC subunit UvrA [Desulfobacterales bacterium]|nr:excinuclease ABC subunit UvrA [Desulfobacterales bacterium]